MVKPHLFDEIVIRVWLVAMRAKRNFCRERVGQTVQPLLPRPDGRDKAQQGNVDRIKLVGAILPEELRDDAPRG